VLLISKSQRCRAQLEVRLQLPRACRTFAVARGEGLVSGESGELASPIVVTSQLANVEFQGLTPLQSYRHSLIKESC